MIRNYTELSRLRSFEERYEYLCLQGIVGKSTFGFDRYLNQILYRSNAWLNARDLVIVRDNGCDLGILGYEIRSRIIIHHMNPISIDDVKRNDRNLFNPEFLICTVHRTHLAIHYGDKSLLYEPPVVRRPGDTCPWR